ncbi:hypothetical protein ACWZEH_31780 [Streptomyces sp. QTS137]
MTSTRTTGAESPLNALPGRWRSSREAGPAAYDGTQGQWRGVGHRGVSAVLADLTPVTPAQQDFETFRQGSFAGTDPPGHRTLRTLVSRGFTPRVDRGLEPRIKAMCARLLDGAAARFTAPDVFGVARSPNPRPALGRGIHFCFGAPLARLEARIALHMPVERFPILAVPAYDDVAYRNPAVIVGVRHLPIAVTRA